MVANIATQKSQKGSEGTKRDSDSRKAIDVQYDLCFKDTLVRFCCDTFLQCSSPRATSTFLATTNSQKDSNGRSQEDLFGTGTSRMDNYHTNNPLKPRHRYIPRTACLHSHALADGGGFLAFSQQE